MNSFEQQVLHNIITGKSVAFIGKDSSKVIKKLLSRSDIKTHVYSIDTVDDYTHLASESGVFIMDNSTRHLASKFPLWAYVDNGEITALCHGHYGDMRFNPVQYFGSIFEFQSPKKAAIGV